MVSDHYLDKWKDWVPLNPPGVGLQPGSGLNQYLGSVTRKEFEDLKKEVKELKKLLERSLEYDKKNNEPDCHIDDKVAILKKIGEAFGVDIGSVFK